jgi:hypothetical protein
MSGQESKTPSWVGWTYVAYIVGCYATFAGVPFYVVFGLGYSPWFLLIGLATGTCYSPWRWFAIWDGIERPFSLATNHIPKGKEQ